MRGATLKHRRGKKEMKQDQKDHYAGMAEHEPSEGAKKWMQSQAYKKHTVEDFLKKVGIDTKGSVMSDDGSTHKANT